MESVISRSRTMQLNDQARISLKTVSKKKRRTIRNGAVVDYWRIDRPRRRRYGVRGRLRETEREREADSSAAEKDW